MSQVTVLSGLIEILCGKNGFSDSALINAATDEITELIPDVDDTDDLDPTAEFDLWRLRELTRLARDKELALAREDERLEIERRKALPEDERMREDMEYVRMKEEEKREGRGENGFLDKFWHKGAFHQVSLRK